MHLLPDWEVCFVLPPAISFALAPGPLHGVIGATIGELGEIRIAGKRKDWVLGQSALAWSKLCRGHPCPRVSAVLKRADEPGPTISGPARKGETIACNLEFDGHTTVMVWGSALRRVSYPVPMWR